MTSRSLELLKIWEPSGVHSHLTASILFSFQLTVVELPESILVRSSDGRTLQTELEVNLGDKLTLLCQVTGGKMTI